MTDLVLGWAQELMTSPWIYVVVWAVAALDGFFPVVPSESLVITAGVFAAQGDPDLAALIAVAAAGAFVGDHTSYLLGHAARSRLDGLHAGSRRQRGLVWARRVLRRRGGLVLVVARYVPGGRTAITLTMGATRYPMTRFTPPRRSRSGDVGHLQRARGPDRRSHLRGGPAEGRAPRHRPRGHRHRRRGVHPLPPPATLPCAIDRPGDAVVPPHPRHDRDL